MNSFSEAVVFTDSTLRLYCAQKLGRLGLSQAHVDAMTEVMVAAERDECHSHGVYRLLTCLDSVRSGKVHRTAVPDWRQDGPLVRVDAQFGFSPLAFNTGLPSLVSAAEQFGVAILIVNHCFHFSALWVEVEEMAARGLAAIALNPSHATVAPAGGNAPALGTNPIAFGWPRPIGDPYVFDFATSAVARGDVELHQRAGTPVPVGYGIDSQGRPTTDPQAVLDGALLTFGGYKGSALSTMIELLAGPMIGDWTSRESLGFEPNGAACHGELVIAFDPSRLDGGDPPQRELRSESLFASISNSGARLPSERRYAARQRTARRGMRIPHSLIDEIDQRFS